VTSHFSHRTIIQWLLDNCAADHSDRGDRPDRLDIWTAVLTTIAGMSFGIGVVFLVHFAIRNI
jgi:hypothetical protein